MVRGRQDHARRVRERCSTADFEYGGRGSQAKKWGQPLEIGKDKKMDSLLESPEENTDTLI